MARPGLALLTELEDVLTIELERVPAETAKDLHEGVKRLALSGLRAIRVIHPVEIRRSGRL